MNEKNIVVMKSKWGVEIEGDRHDLENIERKLNGSISKIENLFVSRLNDLFVLRSSIWDNIPTSNEITGIVVGEMSLIRGCVNLLDGCGDIKIGTIFEFGLGDIIVNQTRFSAIEIRAVKNPIKWAPPKAFAELFHKVAENDNIRDVLNTMHSGADWYEIYKSLEGLMGCFGGEVNFNQCFNAEKSKIKKLKRTANSYRHAVSAFDAVVDPMPLDEARAFLKELMVRSIELVATDSTKVVEPVDSAFAAPKLQYPEGVVVGLKQLSLSNNIIIADD